VTEITWKCLFYDATPIWFSCGLYTLCLQFANANAQFKNIDKLIHYANNADGRLNLFYSTPARYVAAKHSYQQSWPLKTDDFFPYADFPHCYWTGHHHRHSP